MSLKRKITYQIDSLRNYLYNLELPNWFSSRSMRLVLSFSVVVFAAGYVYQISSTAVSGYTINDLQKQVETLQKDIQKVEVEQADYGSMKNIQSRADSLGMVALANPEYYQAPDQTAMARR